jgi:F-type H+-transporting ATPase subunit b
MNPFELNGTFVIFTGLFLVFIYLINQILLKPVGKVIEQRRALIQKDYELAQAYSHEGEATIGRYERQIHEVRIKAQKLIHDSVAAAQSKREKQLKQVKSDGSAKVERMRVELDAQRAHLLTSLIEPEAELVTDIAGKLLGEPHVISIDRESVRQALEEAK